MHELIRRLKPAAQWAAFGAGRPIVRAVNRAATRWQNFSLVRDGDPYANGEYWLLGRCPDAGTYVDVGFNVGDWSRTALALHKQAQVIAFDPDPGAAERAAQLKDPRFSFKHLALGREAGRAPFVSLGPCNPSNSLARAHHANVAHGLVTADVDVVRLDDWADAAGLERIDLLKIDAEGYDLRVAQGASRLFAAGRVDVCVYEYGYAWLEANSLLIEAVRFFDDLGYDTYRLFPNFIAPYRWRSSHENTLAGEFVALRRGYDARFVVREFELDF